MLEKEVFKFFNIDWDICRGAISSFFLGGLKFFLKDRGEAKNALLIRILAYFTSSKCFFYWNRISTYFTSSKCVFLPKSQKTRGAKAPLAPLGMAPLDICLRNIRMLYHHATCRLYCTFNSWPKKYCTTHVI